MLPLRFAPYVARQVLRQRTRSMLTVLGVGTAMFLFCTIESMQEGMRAATRETAADSTLVVYRADRDRPFTSNLPEHYLTRIQRIEGVAEAVPMKITVSNCRASLDVVTFRGVPVEVAAPAFLRRGIADPAAIEQWKARTDAALVGPALAQRRGFEVGQRFDANGLTVMVAGILTSDEPQDQNVAYVHLAFLQYAPGAKNIGKVTQFNVRVTEPELLKDVAAAIDGEFATDQEPTETFSEKAFVGRAAGDLLGLVGFTRIVGLGCIVAVLALVANTIILAARGRVREHAVLQTLGYRGGLVGRLMLAEGALLAAAGGVLGTGAALVFLRWGSFSLSNEGLSINFVASPRVWVSGLAASVILGILASLVPAWQAGRSDIVSSFRSV